MSLQITGRKVAGLAALVALAACAESPTAPPSMDAPDAPSYAKISDVQCKKNDWALSFTSTGASFSSQKDCTAYAKSGGSISTLEIVSSRLSETVDGLVWSLDVRGINLQPGSEITLVDGIQPVSGGGAGFWKWVFQFIVRTFLRARPADVGNHARSCCLARRSSGEFQQCNDAVPGRVTRKIP